MAKKINIIANLIDKQFKRQVKELENGKYKINVDVNGENVSKTTNHVKQLGSATATTDTAFGKLKATIKDTFSAGRMSMTVFLAALHEINKAGKNAKQTIEDINKSITDLAIATNMSREATTGLVKEYNDYAKELKSTTVQVASAADDYLRAGKSISEAKELIKDSIMLSKLGQIDSSVATEDLLATMNGYEMSIKDVGNALDAMVAIDMNAATSAGDLATGLKYSASSANSAGVSFNKLVAILGTVQDKTMQSSEVVGTFANTILSRYRDITIGKYLSDDGEDISNYESVLKSVGIALRNEQGEFRAFETVLQEMADKWNSLTSVQQNALIKVAAGTRQQNRFIALMEGYNKVLQLTEVAANSAGMAVDKFNNAFANSLEARQNELQASFEAMIMNSDMEEVYAGILDATKALVDFMNETNALKGVMTGLAVSGGIKFFLSVRSGINEAYISLNQFANALNIVKQTKISTNDFNRLLLLSKGLSESQMKLLLSSKNLTLAQKEQILVNSGLSSEEAKLQLETWGLTTAQNGLTVATTTVGNAFKGLFATMAANPIMLVTMAVSAGVMAYQSYNQKLEETRQKNIQASDSAIEHANNIKELYGEYFRLSSIQDRTSSEEDEFRSVIEKVTEALGDKTKMLEGLTAGTEEYTEALKKATKEELQNQATLATVGRKSAEEELKSDIWNDWSGSKVSIDSNSKGKSLSDEAQKAVDIVSDALKEYETINRTWDNISWDISSDDPEEAIKYYNSLLKAREDLVKASKDDEALLDTNIYSDMNDAINAMEESLQTYVEKRYEEEKLNYMVQNGIPQTVEEYDLMKNSLMNVVGTSEALQEEFGSLLAEDFSGLASGVQSVADAYSNLENSMQEDPKIFNSTSFSESIQQLSSLQKLYDEFYNNVQDGVDFTFDISDIESLREKFGEVCQSFDEFEKLATSSSTSVEQLQNGFDQLASEFIICSGALNGLDESTRQQIVSQLELQGLMNTSSIITEEVATVIGNASDQNLSLADASDEAYLSLLDESNASETTRMAIYALATAEIAYNNTGLNTKDKIAQLQELASAYGDTASAALAASAAQYAESMSAFHGGSYKDALEYKYNELLNSMNKFSGVQFEISQSAENATKSASKAGKDSADAYVEAYEKELEKLKDLKENGLISEKEYLDRSRVLYEKYFKGIDKYAKNFADAQREYLKGILDYHNKAISAVGSVIDKRTKELEKQKDAEVKGYNDQIKYLDELIKSLDDQIDAKQKEIDAINDAADARKKELDIQKAQYEFLKAQQQRTSLLYKGGQMVYEQDTTNVRDKKTELEDAEREYRIGQLEKEKELIEQQKEAYEKQKESFEEMIDKTEEYFDKMIDSLNEYKDRWDELSDIQSQAESLAVLKELGYTTEDILAMSDSAFETFKSDYLSILADMNSGNDGFLESLAKLGNVEGISGLGSYLEKTQSQIDTLASTNFAPLENEFSKVGSSVSDTKDKVSELSGQIDGGGEKSKSNGYAGNGDPLAGGGKKGESSSLKSSIENETETALSGFGEQADELNNNVSPAITNAKNEMDEFNKSGNLPINKTITIEYKTKGSTHSSSSDAKHGGGGRKLAEGTVGNAFASGTGKYKGLARDEKNALRSEYGQPELTVYPDGKYEITNEPIISDLPKDTVIFNEEQTHKILNNSGKSVSGKSFADGTITLANGTTLTPIQPEDSGYKLVKIAEQLKSQMVDNMIPSFDLIGKNVEIMTSNISKINNNNRQIVNTIQNVNVNCTGVTSQEVAQQIGTELQKTFSGMALKAYQKSSVTR